MTSLLAILGLGFILGVRHAADPDHVIAVGTIVTRHRTLKSAALIGAAWGLGHTLTIVIVGGGVILFRWVIPERLGLSLELAVALMLIVLGVASLRDAIPSAVRRIRAAAPGADSSGSLPHDHDAPLGWLDRRFREVKSYQLARPLIVGVVHGLAGSAAVALVVLAAIEDRFWSVLYLLLFGAGTIVGMMVITAGIAIPFAMGLGESKRFVGRLRLAAGLISVAFGIFLAYRVGFVQGLFTE